MDLSTVNAAGLARETEKYLESCEIFASEMIRTRTVVGGVSSPREILHLGRAAG